MAKSAAKTAPSTPAAPVGRKIAKAFGPGTLHVGGGKMARNTNQPVYCGAIFGRAFGYTEHPNSKDPTKTSTRFAGQFVAINHQGVTDNANECYLPSSIETTIKAALNVQKGTQMASPIEFSVEVWAEPSEKSVTGFTYVCYDRKPQVENDPLFALGVASGLIEDTRRQITDESDVDPETGEVRRAA